MFNQRRPLISLTCLAAYLVASAPGYVTSAFSLARGSASCDGVADCHAACSDSLANQAGHESCPKKSCGCEHSIARSLVVSSSGNHKQGPSLPCNSTCPDGCWLCNALGSLPNSTTRPVEIPAVAYMGKTSPSATSKIEQVHLDNLFRPPIG